MYKLGLDIHGVIDNNPESFGFLSKSVISTGGEVHIITGGSWTDNLKKLIDDNKIQYTHHFSVYDHLKSINAEVIGFIKFPDGSTQLKFNNDQWDSIKGEYCENNKISLHIDDTDIYSNFFKTPFLLFKSSDFVDKLSHVDIRKLM